MIIYLNKASRVSGTLGGGRCLHNDPTGGDKREDGPGNSGSTEQPPRPPVDVAGRGLSTAALRTEPEHVVSKSR